MRIIEDNVIFRYSNMLSWCKIPRNVNLLLHALHSMSKCSCKHQVIPFEKTKHEWPFDNFFLVKATSCEIHRICWSDWLMKIAWFLSYAHVYMSHAILILHINVMLHRLNKVRWENLSARILENISAPWALFSSKTIWCCRFLASPPPPPPKYICSRLCCLTRGPVE